MKKTCRDRSPDQPPLLPTSPRGRLPEDGLVYFLPGAVASFDLGPFFACCERESRGRPPSHPRRTASLLLYRYAAGARPSRKIMRRCQVDVACRVVGGDDVPGFRTLSDFRGTHLDRLEARFVDVLKLCALAGPAEVGAVAPGGAKIKADASRHEAVGYGRMPGEEARLKRGIATIPAEAESADAAEDAAHGRERRGDEPPQESARRRSRLAKVRGAEALPEERARAGAAEEAARRQEGGKPPPAVPPAEAAPGPKDRVNFADPESRTMKVSNEGWDQCGDARAAADGRQIIPAAGVTRRTNDKRPAVPMVDQARANLEAAGVEQAVGAAATDSGLYSEANTQALESRGIDPYVATGRREHHEETPRAPRGRMPADPPAKRRMARKLRAKVGRAAYAKRTGMIEPAFGQLKRVLGFRRSSLRGPAPMRGGWRLRCAVHNRLRLWRAAGSAVAG
jgi:hypothetical protein